MRGASSLVGDGGEVRRGGRGAVRTVVVERKHRLDFFSSRKKKGGFFFTEKTPKTYGVHPGRRRAYLPSRVDFWDAEERVGCGIAGSTSLCRKMEKEVKGWANNWFPRRDSNPGLVSESHVS